MEFLLPYRHRHLKTKISQSASVCALHALRRFDFEKPTGKSTELAHRG